MLQSAPRISREYDLHFNAQALTCKLPAACRNVERFAIPYQSLPMADYWKSQPRKFCDFCKCWITDNKPSVDFHEKGRRHQENVKKKIDDLKKKGLEDAKKQEEENDYMEQMEKAAMEAFKKDLACNPKLAAGYRAKLQARQVTEDKKTEPVFQGPSPRPADYVQTDPPQPVESPASVGESTTTVEEGEWYEALSPDGYPYYWNTVTGASLWIAPTKYVTLTEQDIEVPPHLQLNYQTAIQSQNVSDDNVIKGYGISTRDNHKVPEKNDTFDKKCEVGDKRYEVDARDTANNSYVENIVEKEKDIKEKKRKHYKKESSIKEERNQQPEVPSIALPIEPLVTPGLSMNPIPPPLNDIPLPEETPLCPASPYSPPSPPSPCSSSSESEVDVHREPTQDRSGRAAYGQWTTIEDLPQIDLQLPMPQQDRQATLQVTELAAEPKMKFKEKKVTSLGSKLSGTVAFKKRKLGSGMRNVRQRADDD